MAQIEDGFTVESKNGVITITLTVSEMTGRLTRGKRDKEGNAITEWGSNIKYLTSDWRNPVKVKVNDKEHFLTVDFGRSVDTATDAEIKAAAAETLRHEREGGGRKKSNARLSRVESVLSAPSKGRHLTAEEIADSPAARRLSSRK